MVKKRATIELGLAKFLLKKRVAGKLNLGTLRLFIAEAVYQIKYYLILNFSFKGSRSIIVDSL